jgi:hypothetical protein
MDPTQENPMSEKAPKLGDKYMGGIVVAMGMRDGERWVSTIDKDGGVGLWPIPALKGKGG